MRYYMQVFFGAGAVATCGAGAGSERGVSRNCADLHIYC